MVFEPDETPMGVEEFIASEECDIYCFIGDLNDGDESFIIDTIHTAKQHSTAKIFIQTPGGSAHAAYRIGRALQDSYESLTFIVPEYCKSAGTLLACCADELAIDYLGELGPLDVQMHHHTEPGMRMSGLDTMAALDKLTKLVISYSREQYINFRLGGRLPSQQAVEVSTQTITNVFSPIYAQLDPIRIGEVTRTLRIAKKYGERLNRGNLKKNTLDLLIEDYPCHEFVIDYEECSELFNNVRRLTENESVIIKLFWTRLLNLYEDKLNNHVSEPQWVPIHVICQEDGQDEEEQLTSHQESAGEPEQTEVAEPQQEPA